MFCSLFNKRKTFSKTSVSAVDVTIFYTGTLETVVLSANGAKQHSSNPCNISVACVKIMEEPEQIDMLDKKSFDQTTAEKLKKTISN